MPNYQYEGVTSAGEEVAAVVTAESQQAASRLLRLQGVFVTRLQECAEPAVSGAKGVQQTEAQPVRHRPEQPASTRRIPTPVLLFFVFLGLIATAAACYLGGSTLSRTAGAQRVDGRVVDIVHQRVQTDEGERDSWRVLVEFQLNGQTHRILSSGQAATRLGERLPVLARPDRPQTALIDSFEEKWSPALICGTVGIGFLAVTGLAFRTQRRRSVQGGV